jgi:nucleotide-binding universal stress UspA family protein
VRAKDAAIGHRQYLEISQTGDTPMPEKFVVAYDGSAAGERAVDFAVKEAKETKASLLVVYVLEWSPYSFLTPEELEERHARRKDELGRAESAVIAPLLKRLEGSGVKVETSIKYGHVTETICQLATESGASQIIAGRTGQSSMMSRLFGSVAGALVQVAPVPCTIVP